MFDLLKAFFFIAILASPSTGVLVKFEKREITEQSWIVSAIKKHIRYIFLSLRIGVSYFWFLC
jgi:hypothetical protein